MKGMARHFQKFSWLALLLGHLILLPGCFLWADKPEPPVPEISGNGDGYSGARPRPVIYQWIDPGYQCTTKDGAKISSHRDAIGKRADGSYVQLGDACADKAPTTIDKAQVDDGGDLLGFEEGIYQKR